MNNNIKYYMRKRVFYTQRQDGFTRRSLYYNQITFIDNIATYNGQRLYTLDEMFSKLYE